jgi:hypothetical protein
MEWNFRLPSQLTRLPLPCAGKANKQKGMAGNKQGEREMQYLGNHISLWIILRNHIQNPLQENIINNSHLLHDKKKCVLNLAQILFLLKSTIFSIHRAKATITESTDKAELATKLPAFVENEDCVM